MDRAFYSHKMWNANTFVHGTIKVLFLIKFAQVYYICVLTNIKGSMFLLHMPSDINIHWYIQKLCEATGQKLNKRQKNTTKTIHTNPMFVFNNVPRVYGLINTYLNRSHSASSPHVFISEMTIWITAVETIVW